jgi:hypothetical protein
MKFNEGVYYGQFNTDEDFLVLKNYAQVCLYVFKYFSNLEYF